MTTDSRPAAPAPPVALDHDGGSAWVVVAGSFIGHVPIFGTVYSFTILFKPIREEFGASSSSTAWVVSIATCMMMGMGVVSGRASERRGAPLVVLVGGGLLAVGYLLTSSATAIWQLYLTFGLLTGSALASVQMPSFGVIARRFTRKRGLAIGIASAGSGVASLVVAPLTEVLVDTVGWRDALRILACLHLCLAIVSAWLLRGDIRLPVMRGKAEGPSVTKDPAFRLLYWTSSFASYGYYVPYIFMVPFATDHGVSDGAAAGIVAAMGLASITGRVALGALADRRGGLPIFRLSLALMAIGLVVWPFSRSLVGIGAVGIWYGFFAGSVPALFPTVAVEWFGPARMASIAGLLSTSAAVGALLGPPISGWLHDSSGSYVAPAVAAAVGMVVAAYATRFMPPAPVHATPVAVTGDG